MVDYPIKNADDITIEALEIPLGAGGDFTISLRDYRHTLTGDELVEEMRDQLDVRGSVRNALLRKASKGVLAGIKKGRHRLSEEAREAFDLNILIWFADKALKGEHKDYLA